MAVMHAVNIRTMPAVYHDMDARQSRAMVPSGPFVEIVHDATCPLTLAAKFEDHTIKALKAHRRFGRRLGAKRFFLKIRRQHHCLMLLVLHCVPAIAVQMTALRRLLIEVVDS